jgi:hypothetical protein
MNVSSAQLKALSFAEPVGADQTQRAAAEQRAGAISSLSLATPVMILTGKFVQVSGSGSTVTRSARRIAGTFQGAWFKGSHHYNSEVRLTRRWREPSSTHWSRLVTRESAVPSLGR